MKTTQLEDISEVNKLGKGQASKDLSKLKNLTSGYDVNQLRLKISSLKEDFLMISLNMLLLMLMKTSPPLHFCKCWHLEKLYLLIEAVKLLKLKAGDDLQKL